jgi:hypothetical protein
MTIQLLNEIEAETDRFLIRLKNAKAKMKSKDYADYLGSKESGAFKRSALDLKEVLNKIPR